MIDLAITVWTVFRYVAGIFLRASGLALFVISFSLFGTNSLRREFLLFGLAGALAYFVGGVLAP